MKNLMTISFILIITSMSFAQKKKYDENCKECYIEKVKASHRNIYTEIIIDASADKVWKVLTDFNNMTNWSSTFKKIEGDFKNGADITAIYKAKKDKEKKYEHKLIQEGSMFGWKGDAFAMGMRDNHQFIVKDLGDGKTKFIQSDECYKGATWFFGGATTKIMLEMYISFNIELKKEVENN